MSKDDLKGVSLLMALGSVQRAGTVSSLLYQARDICSRAEDPAYFVLGEEIDKLLRKVPGDSARLARALGVEPEEYDYYDQNAYVDDLVAFREKRGLPVAEGEEGYPEAPPFEHPADLYALLCNPAHSSGGEEPTDESSSGG